MVLERLTSGWLLYFAIFLYFIFAFIKSIFRCYFPRFKTYRPLFYFLILILLYWIFYLFNTDKNIKLEDLLKEIPSLYIRSGFRE